MKQLKENLLFDLRYYSKYYLYVIRENLGRYFANNLPKYLVMWVGIRIASHDDNHNKNIMDAIGTIGEWS